MKHKCDNCPEQDQFNGWKYNDNGVTVFLCGKCNKDDDELDRVISKDIVKNKLEVIHGASGDPKNIEKAIT